MIFIYECLILVLMLINIACAQCPSIDTYSSSDNAFYAMMVVPFPYNFNNVIQFHVQLSIGASVPEQDLKGRISFLGSADDIENKQPLSYKLLWPPHLNSVKRKITQITVNNLKYCWSDPLSKNDFNTITEINLSVTLNISKQIISNTKVPSFTSPPVTYHANPQPNIYDDITTSTTTQPINQNSKSSHCYMPPSSNTLIVRGDSAKIGDYPFLGALIEIKNKYATVDCGATLITDKLVLTAAHCVNESTIKMRSLMFGISDIDDYYNQDRKISSIENYIIHPDYKSTTSDADLAILELPEKLKFSNAINSVCLCGFQDCVENNDYQSGVVAGWGVTETGNQSRTLKQVRTKIVDEESCLRSDGGFNSITSNRTFCAGNKPGGNNGEGPCSGDSGSGFYMYLNERWIIRGVVSRSLTGSDGGCNLNKYIVYVDVSKHFNWVKSYIAKNSI